VQKVYFKNRASDLQRLGEVDVAVVEPRGAALVHEVEVLDEQGEEGDDDTLTLVGGALRPGVNVMKNILGDFCQFSAKKLAFFSKTNVMIKILHNLALFGVKNAIFCNFIGENILKIKTTVPGVNVEKYEKYFRRSSVWSVPRWYIFLTKMQIL
jgi:hypothetical protein